MRLTRVVPMFLLIALICYNIKAVAKVFKRVENGGIAVMVQFEMSGIRTSLAAVLHGGNRLPHDGPELDRFLRDSFPPGKRDVTRDRFGNKYHLVPTRGRDNRVHGFRLISPGPDHRLDTADDIMVAYTDET